MLWIYLVRVYYINGWYIVTYGVGIYLLNNFIGFLSPQVMPRPRKRCVPPAPLRHHARVRACARPHARGTTTPRRGGARDYDASRESEATLVRALTC